MPNNLKIAVLSFGSLLWNSRGLKLHPWNPDGPFLPIEFCRISNKSKKLTLAINEDIGVDNPTNYAISKQNFSRTLDAFQRREKISDKYVDKSIAIYHKADGWVNGGFQKYSTRLKTGIISWMIEDNIDVVIFSALSRRFKDAIDLPFTVGNAINYVNNLPARKKAAAEFYISNVDARINTPFRQAFNDSRNHNELQQQVEVLAEQLAEVDNSPPF